MYMYVILSYDIVEGSLEVKLPTIWTDEKQRWEESEKRREEEKGSKKRKSQKKEDPGARKGRKVAKHCVFPMICGSGGSKSRLAKHAVVARSTFRSQNAQNTTCSDHFWKLRCRKSARRCGAKHICQWKMQKKTPHIRSTFRSCDVEKCTPLSRKAHFEVKMYKTPQLRTTFGSWDVEKVHAVVARSTFWSQKWKKLRGSEHFWTFRCRFAREGFVAFQKTMAGLGHLKRICKDAFSVAGAVQETEMILRDRCSTSYDRYHFFVAGAVV